MLKSAIFFSKITAKRQAIASIDVVPHGLEELVKPAINAFGNVNEIPGELDKITQFTDAALNQFKTGSFSIDWGSFVKMADEYKKEALNCREYVEKINSWRSSGKFENETAAPSNIPKQIAKSMDECQAVVKKINDKIGTIKLLTNPSEIAHLAQNAGLKDGENDKYVVDFTNVMIKVYNTLPAMFHYTEAVIAIGNAFLFAYSAWKAENRGNVKNAQKAAYKSGYRDEPDKEARRDIKEQRDALRKEKAKFYKQAAGDRHDTSRS